MKQWLWGAASVLILSVLGSAAEAQQTSVLYHLEHWEGSAWVEYFPGDPFPSGGGTPGTNLWRYTYEVCNLLPGFAPGVHELNVFFNSDNVLRATWSSASQPPSWTGTKVGPAAPNNNWRERFRTTSTPARIAEGACNDLFQVQFTWVGTALPGIQNYDAVSTAGSDAGTTVPASPVPTREVTWGRLKATYN
jgi:hypothetical protein